MIGNIINGVRAVTSLAQPDTSSLEEQRLQAEKEYLLNKEAIIEASEKTHSIPPFYSKHFSPETNKRDATIRINEDKDNTKLEIKTETGLENTKQPLSFQRIDLQTDRLGIKYDHKINGSNAGQISIKPSKKTTISLYRIGDPKEDKRTYLEGVSEVIKTDKNSLTGILGLGGGKETGPQAFGLLKYVGEKVFLEGGSFGDLKDLKDPSKTFYFAGTYDFGNIQPGFGMNKNIYVADLMIKGFEDVGSMTYSTFDRQLQEFYIKNQTAFGDVDQDFFSQHIGNLTAEYFGVPPFFGLHFSQPPTKGDGSIATKFRKNSEETELEVMLGTKPGKILGLKTDLGAIGIGVNNLNKDGKNNMNAVLSLHKDFDIEGVNGSVEGFYNARTGEVTGYLIMNYEMN